VRVAESS